MLTNRAYQFRLIPEDDQASRMDRTAGCKRFVYNLGLEQRELLYKQWCKTITCAEQDLQLTALKKEVAWLREAPSQPLQQALRDLDIAFEKFFKGLAGYPQYKKKGVGDSFRYPQPKPEHIEESRIYLPKIGWVRYGQGKHQHRVQGKVCSITVSRKNGRWYASVNCEVEIASPKPVRMAPIGMDRGVAISCAMSDGTCFHTPQLNEGEQKRYFRLQRRLARQRKGSNNRAKTKRALAAMNGHLAMRRMDRIHRFTTHRAKNHGIIVLEDLRVKSMTMSAKGTRENRGKEVRQKSGLNRVILQQCWGEIRRQLEYKPVWYGSRVVKVNAAYTSQTCSGCEYEHEDNRVSQSVFVCQQCGRKTNADLNAALVILARGLRVDACAVAEAGSSVRQEASVQGLPRRMAA